jgi:DNA-binding PadR family transcriptional regulator
MRDCNEFGHQHWPFASRRSGFRKWGPFEMQWDIGHDEWGGHRRGRKGRLDRNELRLVLLKLIADEPRHGYELMKALEELTDGAYSPSPGTIYPTLSLLEDEGAIAESGGKAGAKRKAFGATDAGRTELEERSEEVERLMARLAEIGGRRERDRGNWPQLWRAMGNLAGVLRNRFRDGGLDAATIDEMVDIIDEAAKRIERM